jgi:cytochrome c biogenesis protein CcmG/thiol:disulfide interchange protein DsbE
VSLMRTLCTLAVAAFLCTGTALALEQGEKAPPWTARDFAGKEVAFPGVTAGKPSIVLFWATWCPYCKAFMPNLKRIQADYAQAGVTVVAINTKERGRGDPRAYVQSLGFPVIGIADGDRIAEQYGVQYIPGLFVIDGDGTVAYRRPWTDLPAGTTVAHLWERQVRDTLDRLLEERR